MKRKLTIALLVFAIGARNGFGTSDATGFTWSCFGQVWGKYEETENGKRDPVSDEMGAKVSSGFLLNKVQASISGRLPQVPLYFYIQVKFDNHIELLDCYGGYTWNPLLNLQIGQMKIPAPREAFVSPEEYPFVNQSQITAQILDWSLVRTPYIGNDQAVKFYGRDLGISLLGCAKDSLVGYQFMIGNGLGLNRAVGGYEKQEYGDIFSNDFGNFLYAGRVFCMLFDRVSFGISGSYNLHKNYIANEIRYGEVRNLNRFAWSTDLSIRAPLKMRPMLLAGGGYVADKTEVTRVHDLDYFGFAAQILAGPYWNKIEPGVRFDRFEHEHDENNTHEINTQVTLGVNFYLNDFLKLQADYLFKSNDDQYRRNLHDDLAVLNLQMKIKPGLFR